jgi:translation initiation factor 5A
LNADGSTKNDLRVPEGELGEKVRNDFADGRDVSVTVLGAMGQEQIITAK